MFCPECGKETTGNPTFCTSCGAKIKDVVELPGTRLSTVAGIINIIDGGLTFVYVFLSTVGIVSWLTVEDRQEDVPAALAFVILAAALGVLAIVGGISAIQKRSWGLALAGAIAAMVPLFPLGIASVILTAKSRDEFEQPRACRPRV